MPRCAPFDHSLQLFSASPLAAGLGGLIERIGDAANSVLTAKLQRPDGSVDKWADKAPIRDHTSALEKLMRFLGDNVSSSIEREVREAAREWGLGRGAGSSSARPSAAPHRNVAQHRSASRHAQLSLAGTICATPPCPRSAPCTQPHPPSPRSARRSSRWVTASCTAWT